MTKTSHSPPLFLSLGLFPAISFNPQRSLQVEDPPLSFSFLPTLDVEPSPFFPFFFDVLTQSSHKAGKNFLLPFSFSLFLRSSMRRHRRHSSPPLISLTFTIKAKPTSLSPPPFLHPERERTPPLSPPFFRTRLVYIRPKGNDTEALRFFPPFPPFRRPLEIIRPSFFLPSELSILPHKRLIELVSTSASPPLSCTNSSRALSRHHLPTPPPLRLDPSLSPTTSSSTPPLPSPWLSGARDSIYWILLPSPSPRLPLRKRTHWRPLLPLPLSPFFPLIPEGIPGAYRPLFLSSPSVEALLSPFAPSLSLLSLSPFFFSFYAHSKNR